MKYVLIGLCFFSAVLSFAQDKKVTKMIDEPSNSLANDIRMGKIIAQPSEEEIANRKKIAELNKAKTLLEKHSLDLLDGLVVKTKQLKMERLSLAEMNSVKNQIEYGELLIKKNPKIDEETKTMIRSVCESVDNDDKMLDQIDGQIKAMTESKAKPNGEECAPAGQLEKALDKEDK